MSTKRKRTKKSPTKETISETVEAAAEAVEVAAEATSTEEKTIGTPVALEDLKIGYVVGLTQEAQFIFELFGTDKGLVELLGIHQHASRKVDRVYDNEQMAGDRLVHELGRAVAQISQKLDDKFGTEDIAIAEETAIDTTATVK